MTPVEISNRAEYDYCKSRGFEPLLNPNFMLPIELRVEIQNRLFIEVYQGSTYKGKRRIPQRNQRFYKWVWDNKPHRCEETGIELQNYSSIHISHILTKGAHPEMAYDPRNVNILCAHAHHQWEVGDRSKMNIYEKNLQTIELLKSEYSCLTKSL